MHKISQIPQVVDDATLELTRQKSPAEITGIVSRMFANARDRLSAYLRQQHPDWTDEQLQLELRRRIHGAS